LYADGERLPGSKLAPVYLNIKGATAFEFKSKNLRIYFFRTKNNPDKIVALCGNKNRQKIDINRLASIIKRYLNDLHS